MPTWTPRVLDHCTGTVGTPLEDHPPELGGPWAVDVAGVWSIQLNNVGSAYAASTPWVNPALARNLTALADDQAVACVTVDGSGGSGISSKPALGVRCSAAGNGYAALFHVGVSEIQLYRLDAFVATLLTSAPATIVVGDLCRLEIIGPTMTALLNGVAMVTWTDATYASGQTAILDMLGFQYQMADDFAAYDADGGTPPEPEPVDAEATDVVVVPAPARIVTVPSR